LELAHFNSYSTKALDMTQCNPQGIDFAKLGRRQVVADFDGGRLTSDAGLLLLRQVDQKLGLIDAINNAIPDPRNQSLITHSQRAMIAQRVFAIAAGYEDENDHQDLRFDPALQVVAESQPLEDQPLASPPTLCRLENRAARQTLVRLHEVLVEQFLDSYAEPPAEITLDFDATDDPIHGQQEGRFFHGYYGSYCYLPLYVFCGRHPLVAYLRPSNIDAAKHSRAVTRLLVRKIRSRWPETKIILRGDSGFCRWKLMRSCDRMGVKYIFGLAKNARLKALAAALMQQAATDFETSQEKQRGFTWIRYAAGTWDRQRWVIAKAEHTSQGENPRFVVTNLFDDYVPEDVEASPAVSPQQFYDREYCIRGEMENRIKEQQLFLFADRTSCSRLLPNQFRLLLSTFAYVLLDGVRRLALAGTEWANARVDTIRLKLIKIAARVRVTARRITCHLASNCPSQAFFRDVFRRLCNSS